LSLVNKKIVLKEILKFLYQIVIENLDKFNLKVFLPLSFVILFSIIKYLDLANFAIAPTLNRMTNIMPFNESVTQSNLIDSTIIVSLGLISLYFLIQRKKNRFVLIGIAIFAIFLSTQNEYAMELFALLMFQVIIAIIILDHFLKKNIIKKPISWKNLLYTIIGVLFCFELFVLIMWIAFPFSPKDVVNSALWDPVRLEYLTFYAMAQLAPFAIILVVISFASKYVLTGILESFKISIKNLQEKNYAPNVLVNPKIILSIAIGVSIIFAVYPYLPTLNPDYTWRSVDDNAYQKFILDMETKSAGQGTLSDAFLGAFTVASGDRPLTLILMYSFYLVSGLELVSAVRFFPIFLGPGLVLSTYFLVREGTKNNYYAAYAGLLTAFSHQLVVGLYAGFFANWLGMIAAYLAFLMIHRFWNKPSVINYMLVFGHSILSFLLYVYVDVYVLLTLFFFLLITAIKFRMDSSALKKILILSSIFGIYAAVFAIRVHLGSVDLFEVVFAREDVGISITEFRNRWLNFPKSMYYYVGGFLTNLALLAFTVLWLIYAKYENTFDRIILASLMAAMIPLIFGNFVLQSRLLFDLPLQIPAAIAIYRILNGGLFTSRIAKIAFALITIHIAIFTIRSLSNLNLQGIVPF